MWLSRNPQNPMAGEWGGGRPTSPCPTSAVPEFGSTFSLGAVWHRRNCLCVRCQRGWGRGRPLTSREVGPPLLSRPVQLCPSPWGQGCCPLRTAPSRTALWPKDRPTAGSGTERDQKSKVKVRNAFFDVLGGQVPVWLLLFFFAKMRPISQPFFPRIFIIIF